MHMRVMSEESNDPKVEVKTLSFDKIDRVVDYMKDGMIVWQPSRQEAGSNLLIGGTIKI